MKKVCSIRVGLIGFLASATLFASSFSNLDSPVPTKAIFDIDLDVGLSFKQENSNLLSRLRLGRQWIRGETVPALGVSLGKYSILGLGGGIEAEWLHISSGLWVQGKLVTTQQSPISVGVGLGWSLLGGELWVSPANRFQPLLIAKIRLPIGLLTQ